MSKKTVFIALLVPVLIIGASAHFRKESERQVEELAPAPETPEIDSSVSGVVLGLAYSLPGIHIIPEGNEEEFTVVLDSDTRLFSADGSQIDFRDIQPGMHIKAIGKLGPGGMLAQEVWILTR